MSCAEPGAAGAPAFALDSAGVVFGGRPALEGASLAVDRGEAVALVGPSGAGKTTLLRLLCAAVQPTSGRVFVQGRDLARLSPPELQGVRSRIGFVHQDLALVPNLRVSQNVIAGRLGALSFLGSLRAMLLPAAGDLERAASILERVGIREKLFQRTDSLSGGQRQRVAIARALYQGPGALLADEPVSSVDPARARDTVALLREVCAERSLTLVVSLRDGRIVFDRPTREIAERDFAELYRLEGLAR